MTKFVRNDSGTVHSVPDDFTLPDGWEEATEKDAEDALLGKDADPAVVAVELHDNPSVVVDASGTPAGPGHIDERESNDIIATEEPTA